MWSISLQIRAKTIIQHVYIFCHIINFGIYKRYFFFQISDGWDKLFLFFLKHSYGFLLILHS